MRHFSFVFLLLAACSAPAPVEGASEPLAGSPPRAFLDFQPGWVQVQRGAIVRGGHVDVTYARARLSDCAAPTIFAYARFLPSGQLFSSDEAFGFEVPADASSVELWFHAIAPGCEQWDSNYGRNWKFPVVAAAPPAVGWAGDWGSSTARDCQHRVGVAEPLAIDEYMRERACIFIDADVWVPGVTDVAAAHPEWILARVHWAKDAQAPSDAWLDYQGIVGHNARFRWSVPYELRNLADWTTAHYAFSFSTDGSDGLRVAQPSGTDRTIERSFTFSAP